MTEALPAVLVRPAAEQDVPAVAALERVAFSDPWSAGSFVTIVRDPRAWFAVAAEGGTVVGYAIGWTAADEGEIANIAVAPEARGRGIGALLLDEALAALRARGAEQVFLEVREGNVAARGLYASRGFVAVGRRRNYYRKPAEDALVLRLAKDRTGAEG